jgi:glucose/arabinose dehydrogenase
VTGAGERTMTDSKHPGRTLLALLACLTASGGCRAGVGRPAPQGPAPAAERFMPLDEPGRAFTIENAFTHLRFQNPVFAVMPPGRSDVWFVGEREGRVVAVENRADAREKRPVIDLRHRTMGWQDCGLLNLVFHPEFGRPGSANRGYLYLWYNHTETPPRGPGQPYLGHRSSNRLSRFTVPDGSLVADPGSELVLIDQHRSNTDHQGGGMFFHPDDGFLYLTVGDGGHPLHESRGYFWIGVTDDAQRIDRDLLSGLLRIDVDRRGGAISHPIRRQPRNGRTQGYFIPSDNPWVDGGGRQLEEFFAIGLRNPHRASYDPGSKRIFAGDVGDRRIEEVDVLERGGNYQWNFLEGTEPARHRRPDRILGAERGPLFTFTHQTSGSVIGGLVYRGHSFPELAGRYLLGDNGSGQIWTLDARATAPAPVESLLRLPLHMTVYAGLSSFAVDHRGELYLCILGDNDRGTGTLQKLVRAPAAARAAPATLSQTGLFQDTARLEPTPGLFPYQVNAPFWSDHADKSRWLSLPAGAKIGFAAQGTWTFPRGTIAVKHFDLAIDERDPSRRRRLETRVLVLDRRGGAYGRTYKWRPDGREADLMTAAMTERLTRISRRAFGPLRTTAIGGRGPGRLVDRAGSLALASPAGGTLFAHLVEEGDFDLAASFSSLTDGTAGLMMRQQIDDDGPYLHAACEPGSRPSQGCRLRLERRARAGEKPAISLLSAEAGTWIRLRRVKGDLTIFTGADGHLWQQVMVLPGEPDGRLLVGVATSAAARGVTARAVVTAPVRCESRDHTYPADGDCVACHTQAAGLVLGASTRQWNREVGNGTGRVNQLLLAHRRGLLDTEISAAQLSGLARLVPLDDAGATVVDRVRSYLDVNCGQCHRPGLVAQVAFDARYETPLSRQGLVGAPVRWPIVTQAADLMVYPRSTERSRIYSFLSRRLMPPIGSALVDDQALDLLRRWILDLPGPPALGAVTIRRAPPAADGRVQVTLAHPDPDAAIHFTVDDTGPGTDTDRYRAPFLVPVGATVRAAAFRPGFVSSRLASLELRE